MQLIAKKIAPEELKKMSAKVYGWFVKSVIDIKREIMVVDVELHADGQALLLENGSEYQDLWGINMHPQKIGTEDFIEFDSMINIRPRQQNMSRGVEDENIRKQIIALVNKKIQG